MRGTREFFASNLDDALLRAGNFGDRAAVKFEPVPENSGESRIANRVEERERAAKRALSASRTGTVKITRYYD